MQIDTCPKHKIKMKLELVHTGGCLCHGMSGVDDPCYCDAPDVHAELFCPFPRDGERGKRCDHRVAVVPGLTDMRAIERWIAARFA